MRGLLSRLRSFAVLAATLVLLAVALSCGSREKSHIPPLPMEETLRILDAHSEILGDDMVGPGWVVAGLEPLRKGLSAIEGGDPSVREIEPDRARERVARAEVVLVADLHCSDTIRRAFRWIVESLTRPEAIEEGRVAMAFEAFTPGRNDDVARCRAAPPEDGLDPVIEILKGSWPWPVEAYGPLIRSPALRGVPALGAGIEHPANPLPGRDVPDGERKPVLSMAPMSWWDMKYGLSFGRANNLARHRTREWLRTGERRQVFVLYGAAHLVGGWNLVSLLETEGIGTVVLVPFLPEWEAALRRRLGATAAEHWYEVIPGVLRPPFLRDEEIRLLGAAPDAQ